MTCSMKAFLNDCLKLSHVKNSQDNPLHEIQVKDLLDKHELNYTYQPNGSQNSPDFLVHYNGKDYPIECKSSTVGYPTYNGGLPKIGFIYIFSSSKYNETTIYFGEDIVAQFKRNLLKMLTEDINDIVKWYQSLPEWEDDDRGVDFYPRPMYVQKGGKKKTDYFVHKDRKQCERNVLETNY